MNVAVAELVADRAQMLKEVGALESALQRAQLAALEWKTRAERAELVVKELSRAKRPPPVDAEERIIKMLAEEKYLRLRLGRLEAALLHYAEAATWIGRSYVAPPSPRVKAQEALNSA